MGIHTNHEFVNYRHAPTHPSFDSDESSFHTSFIRGKTLASLSDDELSTQSGATSIAKTTRNHTPAWNEHVIPKKVGNFALLAKEKLEFSTDHTIAKWRSKETGLSVVWANTEGPLVESYIQVPTEIFSDAGIPHTLEHLIFLGSEQYKYKSVLDKLTNKMMGNGTNAWTGTNATCFTAVTASSQGMMSLLPVYLDHIFFPTLTEQGFITEVYHITEKGDDSGVVLSEMEGNNSDPASIMRLAIQRQLYNTRNANRSETGGLPVNLRSLNIEQIRDFHDIYYVPQNIQIVVIGGTVDPRELLQTIQNTTEKSLIEANFNQGSHPSNWIRPWIESSTPHNPPVIPGNIVKEVQFPSEDSSVGHVSMRWVGPSLEQREVSVAMDVLDLYLTQNSACPLNARFVEVNPPWCSSVSLGSDTNSDPVIFSADFSDVAADKIDTIVNEFMAELAKIASPSHPIDMTQIRHILNLQELTLYESVEGGISSYISGSVLNDHLFGARDGTTLRTEFRDMHRLKKLAKWDSDDWKDLISTWLLNKPYLAVICKPSKPLVKQIADERTARMKKKEADLGPRKMAKISKRVKDAVKFNNIPAPEGYFDRWPAPPLKDIVWTPTESAVSLGVAGGGESSRLQDHINREGVHLPYSVHFSHLDSKFVEISVIVSPVLEHGERLRVLSVLPLYLNAMGTLPVLRANQKRLSSKEAIKKLDKDTRGFNVHIGAVTKESVNFSINVVKEKYKIGIAWLRDLMYYSVWDLERLKVCLGQLVQDLPGEKSDGETVVGAGLVDMIQDSNSILTPLNLFTRMQSLVWLRERLLNDPKSVQADLDILRNALTNPRAMKISVEGDIYGLAQPSGTWLDYFCETDNIEASDVIPFASPLSTISLLAMHPSDELRIYSVAGTESTYAFFACKGLDSWRHPDYFAVKVACMILNATEGFLWNAVRGVGLAYGANISFSTETGLIKFSLFKCPDTHEAWTASKKLFSSIASNEIKITPLQIEAAVHSIAFQLAEGSATRRDAAAAEFVQVVFDDKPKEFSKLCVEKCSAVTLTDLQRVFKKYFLGLFDKSSSIGSISASESKFDEQIKKFQDEGYTIVSRRVK